MSSKLLQEKEIYRRKLARARRIARIQRRRRIDDFFKKRMYTIVGFLAIIIVILIMSLNKTTDYVEEQSLNLRMANELLERVSESEMMKINLQLARAVDSLQILIFVYNRRHQKDQADIQYLMTRVAPKNRVGFKKVDHKLEFPEHVGEDSLKYKFFPDSTGADSIPFFIDEETKDTVYIDE